MHKTIILSHTFCSTTLKLINDNVPLGQYFINDNGFLHKVVIEDDKLFHALVVTIIFSQYALHQVHDGKGHNGTARTYQCL